MTNDVDTLLDRAFASYNTGDYSLSEQLLKNVLLILPSHGDALYLLGLIAYKKGIFTQAIDLLNVVCKLYPNQDNYHLALAEIYQGAGQLSNAKKIYQKYRDNELALEQLGWIALDEGKHSVAKKIFNQLLVGSFPAHGLHGLGMLENGKKRLKLLERAISVEKTSAIITDLVDTYLSLNQNSSALKYVDQMTDDVLRAKIYFVNKQFDLAEESIKLAIQNDSFNIKAYELYGRILEAQNKINEALSAYQQTLKLDPKSYEANKGCARIYMMDGKIPLALNHYQELVHINDCDIEASMALATIQEQFGAYTEALGLYFRLLTLGKTGLDRAIYSCIQKLSDQDLKTAQRFARGWKKHHPHSKLAIKIFQKICVCFFVLFFATSLLAESPINNDEKWEDAWLLKMAQYQNPESEYQLAERFESGTNVPQNYNQAIYYYQLSAKHHYLPAALKLGELYARDLPIQDTQKSLEWYQFAADRGEIQAQLYLADYFYQHQDWDKSKKYYDLSLKVLFPNETDFTRVSPQYQSLMEKMETHL